MSVAVTAAFLTGLPLQIRMGEYEGLQGDLGRELGLRVAGQGWLTDPDHRSEDGTYHSGGGFTSKLPLILARRDGPDALARATDILRERPGPELAWLAHQTDGWKLRLASMRIDIYDLGMAVMNGTFSVRVPKGLNLQAAARALKRLVWLKPDPETLVDSPITAMFRTLATETTQQFEAAIGAAVPHTVQQPWLLPFLNALPENRPSHRTRAENWGRVLWLHPVHLLEIDDSDELQSAATELAPPFHRAIEVPDGRFVPGIGWSALVTHPQAADTGVPLRLIELHWAYFALYMEIDRGLLALLDKDHRRGTDSLSELERDADRVFADFMRVMEARARVDSTLASLGSDGQAIWDAIADVTRFDALVHGVDRKVDALQRVAERRVQQAASAQAHRNVVIAIIAVGVAVGIPLLGFLVGSDALPSLERRVFLVAVAVVLVAIAIVVSVNRYRAHRGRP